MKQVEITVSKGNDLVDLELVFHIQKKEVAPYILHN